MFEGPAVLLSGAHRQYSNGQLLGNQLANDIQCTRLQKECQYADAAIPNPASGWGRVDEASLGEQLLDSGSTVPSNESAASGIGPPLLAGGPKPPLPRSFFLDTDFFTPLGTYDLSRCLSGSAKQIATAHIRQDHQELCQRYFTSVHRWIPMISRKRLIQDLQGTSTDVDGCLPLLLSCMEICTCEIVSQPSEFPPYVRTRSMCAEAESAGFVSLRLVQSLILLSVYEVSHAIYPAGYLTISRAARLGMVMGMHDRRNAQQLFKPAETWTLREEQRRTWWAIFILDRVTNIELSGMPFAAPEPASDELLPISDRDWEIGKIGVNESLYTTSFSASTSLGSFAQMCQASHILGKVIHHRVTRRTSRDATGLLTEALSLHNALLALYSSLDDFGHIDDASADSRMSTSTALAICISGRLLLYNQYGCNESFDPTALEPISLNVDMQRISLEGVKSLAFSTARKIAKADDLHPLMASCLYHAATECAWFIQEDEEPEMYQALKDIVRGLQSLGRVWRVGEEYIALLREAGTMKLIDSGMDYSEPSGYGVRL